MIAQARNAAPTDATTISAVRRAARCLNTRGSRIGGVFPKADLYELMRVRIEPDVVSAQTIVKSLRVSESPQMSFVLIIRKEVGVDGTMPIKGKVADKILTFSDSKSHILLGL